MRYTPQTKRLEHVDAVVRDLLTALPATLIYHKADHTLHPVDGVVAAAHRIGTLEGITSADAELVETAAYFHDTGYLVTPIKNEPIGADYAAKLLPGLGYSSDEITVIRDLILVTDLALAPKTHLERILRDADVENLGRADFFEKSDALRREYGITDKAAWVKGSIGFLTSHKWYTVSANSLLGPEKRRNLLELQKMASYGRAA
ncbi:MAG: hypothetical protein Q7R96_05625 [Nanoarchaeota archaeon]|nr:hypothetical protein [Nanoarchaeota archaeon]